MNIKGNLRTHNRFRIEVRDAETNELKQEAKAENIVLDNWGIDDYALSIHFGSGTDKSQQNSAMTDLIEKIDAKDLRLVSTEWRNDVFVMNYKADQIGAEEFNGKTIAEVGIYGDELISHAFITDSEGNLLTITKTAKDVITLYATIYFKSAYERYRVNDVQSLHFLHFFIASDMSVKLFQGDSQPLTRIDEITGKHRRKYCWQLSNESLNGQEIRGFAFTDRDGDYIRRVMVFPCAGLYEGTNISKGKLVGEKNGLNTQFDLPWDCVRNLKIYKNGQLMAENQYTVNANVKKSANILKDAKTIQTDGTLDETQIERLDRQYTIPYKALFDSLAVSGNGGLFRNGLVKNLSEYTIELRKPATVTHYKVKYDDYPADYNKRYEKIKIDMYADGQWHEVYNGYLQKGIDKRELNQDITNVSKVRVKLTEPISNQEWKQLPYVSLYNDNDIHHITFNEPPLAADVLEYDGFVDYIPKDKDHIVKFNFDITLTPGAGE